MNVYQKLQKARIQLAQTSMRKSGHNKFAGYQYFELGDFLQPIQTIFDGLGLCGLISFSSDIATLKVVNTEKPEEIIEFTSPMGSAALKGCHEVQNIGAVETYQRRYLYVAAMEIVEHDAIDSQPLDAKPVATHTSVAKEAFSKFSEEEQQTLRDVAIEIIDDVIKGNISKATGMFKEIEDNDLKVGLWSLLDSKTRSQIKKQMESEKTK